MSNGYIVATGADLAAAHEISDGFGLDVIDASTIDDPNTAATALAAAANVGLVVSSASARDERYVAILRAIAQHLQRAQLIFADAGARAAVSFLPDTWPSMTLDDARARSAELVRRRDAAPGGEPTHAAPVPPPPAPELPPHPEPTQDTAPLDEEAALPEYSEQTTASGDGDLSSTPELPTLQQEPTETEIPSPPPKEAEPPRSLSDSPPEAPHVEPPPRAPLPPAPPQVQPAPVSAAPPPVRAKQPARSEGSGAPSSAPADATAFAPKKLRRTTPELIQIAVHQPRDLKEVIRRVRRADARATDAGTPTHLGDVAIGSSIGVALEVHGAACDGTMQRQVWRGQPLLFPFSATIDGDARQATFQARVFLGDAQVGVIGFVRGASSPKKKPIDAGNGERMKRHKQVFLSYSSKDRELVAAIATAYEAAGVPHFWDRASLKSGEEWSPRLRQEIDRADLFHLCWSKAAAASQWVEKETEHALTRRKRSNGRNPDITVQMLDGPPWAPHKPELDAINFDDFVRAAIVGYARGDGST